MFGLILAMGISDGCVKEEKEAKVMRVRGFVLLLNLPSSEIKLGMLYIAAAPPHFYRSLFLKKHQNPKPFKSFITSYHQLLFLIQY